MTVCVSVKVNDCIVFAADSALTMSRGGEVVNVYNHGDKIFNLHRNCPVAAMFCGMGNMAGRSISNLSKELRWELMSGERMMNPDDYSIESVVTRAHEFFAEKYAQVAADESHSMEYYVSGYGAKSAHGEVWKFQILSGTMLDPTQLRTEGEHGINWGGQTSPIARLIGGLDPNFLSVIKELGVVSPGAEALRSVLTERFSTPLYDPAMPTNDVIRLAEFLVDVTKGYYSFAEGSDIVGGPTDIASVTRWEGFRWIKRKHYYPQNLNGSDHGHVC